MTGLLAVAACGTADAPPGTSPPGGPPATASPAPPVTTAPEAPPVAEPDTAGPTTPGPAPGAEPVPGPALRGLPVTRSSVVLVDASRPTVSRGRTLAPSRTLPTTVAAPATGGPYPLVLFAHGYQLGPPGYARVIDVIAAAGYVVAAPSFPLADAAVGGSTIDRADIPNQSGDLRFVADQLTAAGSAVVPADLRGRIDGTRVGAVGHSDGADTVIDLGYHRDRSDGRVRTVAALSPDAVPLPGGPAARPPLLLVHGSADRVTPFSESSALFGRVPVPRWLVTLVGADHLPPVQGAAPWAAALDRAVLAVLDRYVGARALPPGADLDAVAAPGVAEVRAAGA
jgi:predicted dienelactone hydrolase